MKNSDVNYTHVTLVIVHDDNRVLLGMKKRGFGEGKYNGFGGKVQEGETIDDAAWREFKEETGLQALDLRQVGELYFHYPHDNNHLHCHVFKVTKWHGEVRESEEMMPEWFLADDIPFAQMWPDDEYWLPSFLNNDIFSGRAVFDKDHALLDWQLDVYED